MKYIVGIMLPAKLSMSMVLQAGEVRTVCAAYKTAVLKTITCIREHKTEHLLGNRFTHIPHDEKDEDPRQDSYRLAKKHPHAASEHMDRCKDMLSMFYDVHRTLVGETGSLLEEITEPTQPRSARERERYLDNHKFLPELSRPANSLL
jgi:hypothetical protein